MTLFCHKLRSHSTYIHKLLGMLVWVVPATFSLCFSFDHWHWQVSLSMHPFNSNNTFSSFVDQHLVLILLPPPKRNLSLSSLCDSSTFVITVDSLDSLLFLLIHCHSRSVTVEQSCATSVFLLYHPPSPSPWIT